MDSSFNINVCNDSLIKDKVFPENLETLVSIKHRIISGEVKKMLNSKFHFQFEG